MNAPAKFHDPMTTAKGESRASVSLQKLRTLWFNTGSLCNLTCENCYIESSPRNDALVYLERKDVAPYLDEIKHHGYGTELIGLTGGEPFLNPNIIAICKEILSRGFPLLVLTNAYKVLRKHKEALLALKEKYADNLRLRVSLDHHSQSVHDGQRGKGAFAETMAAVQWLYEAGFNTSIAGRSLTNETDEQARAGYSQALRQHDIGIDTKRPTGLVIFPEMFAEEEVPEITTSCWDILSVKPEDQMCASERMIVKRKGADHAVVLPCTLLAYDDQFELGDELATARRTVYLNHRYCAKFCVLGGASCSAG